MPKQQPTGGRGRATARSGPFRVHGIFLEGEAYGVAIHDDIEGFIGRPVSTAAVYDALARLERRTLLRSTVSAPLAVQGGRSKRLFEVTSTGRTWLKQEQTETTRLWQALPASFRRRL